MLSNKLTVVFSHKFNAEIKSQDYPKNVLSTTELANQILLIYIYIMFMYIYCCTRLKMQDSETHCCAENKTHLKMGTERQTHADTNSNRIIEGKEKRQKRSIQTETLMKQIQLPTLL